MFDAKAFLAAMERPTFVDEGGHQSVGRPLSHPQYHALIEALGVAQTPDETAKAFRDALVQMELPADVIMALPLPAFTAATTDFFRCCRGESPSTPPAPSPTP